jgi:hypothetical protein
VRQCLRLVDGYKTLYNVDHAAHKSTMEGEGFKEVVIPKMTEMLTKRLTDALEPFFHESQKHQAIEKLRPSLRAVFKLAVEARAESLLSASDLRLIWPVAGSAANEAEMEVSSSKSIANPEVVKLPLLPGLCAFSKEKMTMVDYRGLAQGTLTETPQLYVVKALVLY